MEDRDRYDHYVTQHFLKLFTNDEGLGCVGDMRLKRVSRTADFTHIFGERNWSVNQQVEDAFGRIEDKVARSFKAIDSNPELIKNLSPQTRQALLTFIVIHHARSVAIHQAMDQVITLTVDEMKKRAPEGASLSALDVPATTRSDSLLMGLDVASDFTVALAVRDVIGLLAPRGHQFILGDNPLVKLSTNSHWAYRGNIESRNTYFWFPLTPRVGLLFGSQMGGRTIEDALNYTKASKTITTALNQAEVYSSSRYILGASKRLVSTLLHAPHLGDDRTEVTSSSWHPFIFQINKDVSILQEDVIDAIRERIDPAYTQRSAKG